jgi:hypothetical protein
MKKQKNRSKHPLLKLYGTIVRRNIERQRNGGGGSA